MAGILPLCQGLKQQLNAAVKDGSGGGPPFNPHSFVFFLFFFAQCLLRPKKMPGLLIISVLNGLFKAGHVKVRGWEINHTDSSFPPVELVALLPSLQSA